MCASDPRSDLDQSTTKACFCGVARYISFDIWQGCARQIHAAIWTNPQRRRTLVEQPYMHFLIFAIAFFLVATFYPHPPSNVKDLYFLYLSAGHGNTMIHYDPTLVQDQLYLLAEGTLLLEIGYTDLNYLQDHFHLGSGGAASFFG